jgi:hypothetical protein
MRPAGTLVGLYVNDKCDEWEKEYSQLMSILDLASDLEWSNIASPDDVPDYWQSIKHLVDDLERQVTAEHPDI